MRKKDKPQHVNNQNMNDDYYKQQQAQQAYQQYLYQQQQAQQAQAYQQQLYQQQLYQQQAYQQQTQQQIYQNQTNPYQQSQTQKRRNQSSYPPQNVNYNQGYPNNHYTNSKNVPKPKRRGLVGVFDNIIEVYGKTIALVLIAMFGVQMMTGVNVFGTLINLAFGKVGLVILLLFILDKVFSLLGSSLGSEVKGVLGKCNDLKNSKFRSDEVDEDYEDIIDEEDLKDVSAKTVNTKAVNTKAVNTEDVNTSGDKPSRYSMPTQSYQQYRTDTKRDTINKRMDKVREDTKGHNKNYRSGYDKSQEVEVSTLEDEMQGLQEKYSLNSDNEDVTQDSRFKKKVDVSKYITSYAVEDDISEDDLLNFDLASEKLDFTSQPDEPELEILELEDLTK